MMKSAWFLITVACLLSATDRCRSQDAGTVSGPVVADASSGASEAIPAAAEPTSPPSPDAAPPAPAEPVVSPLPPLPAPCLSGPGHRCFRQQLIDWLTYRPLSQDICDCFPRCVPCCEPRLYLFFVGPCCVNPAEIQGRATCARNAACGCRNRCAGPCEQPGKCASGKCPGSFHWWPGWDALLFNHPKTCCAATPCVAGDNGADMSAK
jgi:hypothetical protein